MRAFIALEFDDRLKEIVTKTQQALKTIERKIAWVNPQQAHLTLKFFADINDAQVEEIKNIMKNIFENIPPHDFLIEGLGTFPDEHSPRVIWLGIQDHKNTLKDLNNQLEKSLRPLSLPLSDKPFEPHITIGRIKILNNPQLLKESIKHIPLDSPEITLKSIVFIKSVLTFSGPNYSDLKRFPCS
jgi:RNA 2',3'-cyclic 3'-phosphodiesterase